MPERNPGGRSSPDDLLRGIVADQAQGKARFDEIFRRLKDVEATSSEARDIGKEVLTVLREQNALARIEEVRAEMSGQVTALRADLVHSNKTAREHVDDKLVEAETALSRVSERVLALEGVRQRGVGMAQAGKLALDILKFLAGAGVGGAVIKLIGG